MLCGIAETGFIILGKRLAQAMNVDDALEDSSNQSFEGVVAIIRNGQAHGVFRQGDADEPALTAWSVVHGFAMLASTGMLEHRAATKQSCHQTEQVGPCIKGGGIPGAGFGIVNQIACIIYFRKL